MYVKVLIILFMIVLTAGCTTPDMPWIPRGDVVPGDEIGNDNPYLTNLTKNHNFVVEKSFDNFTTSWYYSPGLTQQEYIISIQNHITENRETNISSLISDTNFNIDDVSDIQFKEYKLIPYNYTVDHYDYINHSEWNETNQTWNNWTESAFNYTETIEDEKLWWKACKMKTFSQNDKEIKEGYGDILIPLYGSKDKGTGTVNGTKIFKLTFSTLITDMGDGWGSSGRIALDLDGFEHCPYWNVSYDIRLKMPINNTAGAGVQTDFQVGTNISAYSANTSSLRCYNRSTGNISAHWIESVAGGNVEEIWINNSVIASGWDNNTFCSWQTTPTASSSSSISDTFIFGDDFPGSSIDTSKWGGDTGSAAVSSGTMTLTDVGGWDTIYSLTENVIPVALRTKTQMVGRTTGKGSSYGIRDPSTQDWCDFVYYDVQNTVRTYKAGSSTTANSNIDTSMNVYDVKALATTVSYWKNDVEMTGSPITTNIPIVDLAILFNSNGGAGYEIKSEWALIRKYNATPPVYESPELEYYIPSLYHNTTPVSNIIYSSPHEYALNQTPTGKTNTNDTTKSTGLSEIVVTNYNNSASIVRNFTLTGDDLDWYQAANLTGSYSMKNSSSTVQTVNDGNFTVNLVAGDYWIESYDLIISFAPSTPVSKTAGDSQIFNVTTSENTDCKWYIDGTLVQTNATPATEHNYTNTSLATGLNQNFSAVVNCTNGTDMQTWDVDVTAAEAFNQDMYINYWMYVTYLNSSNTNLSEESTELAPYYLVFFNATDQKTYGYKSSRWEKYADKIIKPGEVAMLRYAANITKNRYNATGTFGLTLKTGLNHIGHSYNGTRNLTWYNTTIASSNLSTIQFQYPENGTLKLYTYGSSANGSVDVPQGFGVEVNVTAETVISGL